MRKRRVIIAVLIVLAVVAGIFLYRRLHRPEVPEPLPPVTATPTATPTPSPTPTPTPSPTPTPTPEPVVAPVVDFPALWAVNPDCYAYIEIPDTVVSYPILQSTIQEEDYYLDTTFEGASGYPGSIYTQMVSETDFSELAVPL